jgi:Zn-dependent protease with chaperone function
MNQLRAKVSRPAMAVVMALMLAPTLAQAQTKVKAGFNLFSAEQDVEVGRQSAAEANAQLPLMTDSQIDAYVNRIGQRLVAQAPGPKFPYEFHVVNSTDINAFALPGGPIYVNRGVLEQAKNEGEVAGVIAHEISHVALRHGTHQASKAYVAQAGISLLGGLLGGKVGQGTANIINAVGGFGLNALFLKYSRDLETQADVRGAQILAASGYSPQDMVNFFHTLERVDTAKKTNWLSDHPAPPDRIARIQKEAQMLQVSANPNRDASSLNTIQARLRGTGSGTRLGDVTTASAATRPRASSKSSGATGAVVRVDPPSGTMRTYTSNSGVYQVAYPANWQAYPSDAGGVTIVPQGGAGDVNGRTEIVYGAIVNHYDPFGNVQGFGLRSNASAGGNISLTDATNDLVGQIRSSSPHLSVISGSTQRLTLDGGPALAASLRGTNPNTGIKERVTIVTRQLADDHLVYMLFVTPDADAAKYQPTLQSMVSSLRIDEEHRH